MKKEKKHIAPNEASLGRWIATLVVNFPIAVLLIAPLGFCFAEYIEVTPERTFLIHGTILGLSCNEIVTDLAFCIIFLGMVIALKLVGKTSLKDFVLGVGGKINWKECLTILGLYVAGMAIGYLPFLGYIRLQSVNPGAFAFQVLFLVLTVWMQSTWEELVFRGLLIRWACKNKVGFTKKTLILAVATSVAFAVAHHANPEVTTQSGIRVALAFSSYAVTGLMFFLTDLYFGSLMPGIVIHWINNFLLSFLIGGEVSVIATPKLLLDTTPHTGETMLLSSTLAWLPLIVYMVLDYRKKKKAAAC